MTPLTIIPAKKMAAILHHLGFECVRQRGSHAYFKHLDGRTTIVPMHQGEDLGRGLIRRIPRDIELSVEEYEKIRHKA